MLASSYELDQEMAAVYGMRQSILQCARFVKEFFWVAGPLDGYCYSVKFSTLV
jgi:hypothetical protein